MLTLNSLRFSSVVMSFSAVMLLATSCGAVDKLRHKDKSEDSPAPTPTPSPTSSKSADANAPSPSPSTSPVATVEGLTIEDYNSFLGLHYGDKIDRAVAIFGQANETSTEGDLNFYRYAIYSSGVTKTVLMISTYKDNDKIFSINVAVTTDTNETLDYFRRNSVSDKRLQPLGMPLESIQKTFGKETTQSSQMYEYNRKLSNGNDIEVSFSCFDFWNHECRSFEVIWFQR